jgi:D-tyrosyl-tRNA(Tyr) deacylase
VKAVIQRVSAAEVIINNITYSKISNGLLVFIGVEKGDSEQNAEFLSHKIVDLRIFSDENEKMNLSVKDINGDILIISQFTLCTVEKSGNRPSFTNAESPDRAQSLYTYFIQKIKDNYIPSKVYSGLFAEMMEVRLENDGPVTIILERK